jgi:hypothetical protein
MLKQSALVAVVAVATTLMLPDAQGQIIGNHQMDLQSHSCVLTNPPAWVATLAGVWRDNTGLSPSCGTFTSTATYSVNSLWPQVGCPSQYAVHRSRPWIHPGGCTCVQTTHVINPIYEDILANPTRCDVLPSSWFYTNYDCQP